MKTNDAKHLILNDPRVLLRKPSLIIFLPQILATGIINKLKQNIEKVYFVETMVDDYLLNKNIEQVQNGFSYKVIDNFSDFEPILKIRFDESPDIKTIYTLDITKRFKKDHKAFVIYQESIPLGYIFIQINQTYISQVKYQIDLPKNVFTFIDLYIFNNYRGKNLHEFLYTYSINWMKEKGYDMFYCWLMKHNQKSIKAHIKIGIFNITKIIIRKSFLGYSSLKVRKISDRLHSLIYLTS